jgi:hypothetical protein
VEDDELDDDELDDDELEDDELEDDELEDDELDDELDPVGAPTFMRSPESMHPPSSAPPPTPPINTIRNCRRSERSVLSPIAGCRSDHAVPIDACAPLTPERVSSSAPPL